jgi:hypothetical protein
VDVGRSCRDQFQSSLPDLGLQEGRGKPQNCVRINFVPAKIRSSCFRSFKLWPNLLDVSLRRKFWKQRETTLFIVDGGST